MNALVESGRASNNKFRNAIALLHTAISSSCEVAIPYLEQRIPHSKMTTAADQGMNPDSLSFEALQPPHMTPSTSSQGKSRSNGPSSDIPSHLYKRLPKHCLLLDGTPDYLRLILTSRVYDLVQPSMCHCNDQLSPISSCCLLSAPDKGYLIIVENGL